METTVTKTENTNGQLQSFDLMGKLPNLADAKVIPADLTSEYWTPEYRDWETDRKSTRLNSSHSAKSRMPSSA